jgi:hypothetical protein
MNKYTLVADMNDDEPLTAVVVAENEKAARRSFWDNMDDDEKDRTASIECVDVAPLQP